MANGAAELIKILGNKFMRRMTIPTPSFNEYEEVIAPDGLNRFALDPSTFELDVDAFAASAIAWRSDTAIVVTPNNPTALSVSRDDVLRLARRLEARNGRLIVDESFIEFARGGTDGSVESAIEVHPNLVVIKSLSKVFGIAGLRIGYLLSADRAFIELYVLACRSGTSTASPRSSCARWGAIDASSTRSCDLTRSACAELYADLDAMQGLDPIEPDANFILARLGDSQASGSEVARRLYVEHNILIKDCAAKSMPTLIAT